MSALRAWYISLIRSLIIALHTTLSKKTNHLLKVIYMDELNEKGHERKHGCTGYPESPTTNYGTKTTKPLDRALPHDVVSSNQTSTSSSIYDLFFFLVLDLFTDSTDDALLPSSFFVSFTMLDIPFRAAARCSGLRLIILRSRGQ